jgi:hypothetical protein
LLRNQGLVGDLYWAKTGQWNVWVQGMLMFQT